jgi:hypothetical protein
MVPVAIAVFGQSLAILPQKCPQILDVKICRSNLWEEFDDISPLKIRLGSPRCLGENKKLTRISAEQVMVEGELHPLAFTRGTVSFGRWILCVILMLVPLASS